MVKLLKSFAAEHDVRLVVREDTFVDCFCNANYSLQFHGLDFDKVNQFKEVAHLAFWISKLKPVRIRGSGQRNVIAGLMSSLTTNNKVDIEEASPDSELRLENLVNGALPKSWAELQKKSALNFEINEWIAVSLVLVVAKTIWKNESASQADKLRSAATSEQQKFLEERFKHKTTPTLMFGLKHYNFSARGLATSIEMALETNLVEI
jgi:hypothetical protein